MALIPGLEIQHFAGPPGEAHLATVLERLEADLGRLAALGVDMGDVRDVQRGFLLDDAPGLARPRPRVPLDRVHALHEHAVAAAVDAQNLALLALVAAGHDHDLVALLDL